LEENFSSDFINNVMRDRLFRFPGGGKRGKGPEPGPDNPARPFFSYPPAAGRGRFEGPDLSLFLKRKNNWRGRGALAPRPGPAGGRTFWRARGNFPPRTMAPGALARTRAAGGKFVLFVQNGLGPPPPMGPLGPGFFLQAGQAARWKTFRARGHSSLPKRTNRGDRLFSSLGPAGQRPGSMGKGGRRDGGYGRWVRRKPSERPPRAASKR